MRHSHYLECLKNLTTEYTESAEGNIFFTSRFVVFSGSNYFNLYLTLIYKEGNAPEEALEDFYNRFKDDPLVVDKWLSVQATSSLPTTLETVKALLEHEAFSIRNPNKVRSLIGAFAHANQLNFHHVKGEGYEFHTDRILELDKINPQIAARMIAPLDKWRRFDKNRQELMKAQLERIIKTEGLSNDTFEIATKSLG